MVGRTSLQTTGSVRFDVKTKLVVTESYQLSTIVLKCFLNLWRDCLSFKLSDVLEPFFGPEHLEMDN